MSTDAWYWAHDARPDQLDSLATPGLRLVRLSHYGADRYATLYHAGTPTQYRLGLDAATASSCTDAIAITVDGRSQFAVVTDPSVRTRTHVDLDEDEARSAIGEIVDAATYTLGGARRYAIVVRDDATPSWLLPNLTPADLHDEVRRLDAGLVRLRAHAGEHRFTAIAARTPSTWYGDLSADDVASRLERHRAVPVDLDATATPEGVRFTVVMR